MERKNNMTDKLIITPKTKIGEMMDSYPELEELLIEIAPTFKKLKSPILRRTIAKVTTLEQAAKVGNVCLEDMINKLRAGIGQDDIGNLVVDQASLEKPDWMDESKIVKTLDARKIVNNGGHPVGQVLKEVRDLKSGEIYEMIAPFLPAPLIDQVAEQGYKTWTIEPDLGFFRCFFYKA